MQRVCPQCKGIFAQFFLCPKCGVQLQDFGQASTKPGATAPSPTRPPSFWGRLFVGLLLAQGLYYALRQLVNAYLVATGDPATWWPSFPGLVTLQGLQAIALLAGGVVAGAGQARGLIAGLLLGVWNACLLLIAHSAFGHFVNDLMLYGLPVLHGVVGALGGAVASRIWRPVPKPGDYTRAPSQLLKPPAPSVPFAWGKILLGAALAVSVTVWAHTIRGFMTDASGGALRADSRLQVQFITWELSTLAILVGSAFAGAGSASGLKQGVAVGLLAGSGIVGTHAYFGHNHYPAMEFLFEQFGGTTISGPITAQLGGVFVANALLLSMLGGWFGGQLMPPLAPPRPKLRAPE